MKNYLELLKDIIDNGSFYGDRTKVGRISVFGRMLRFNLQEGFPLVTTKKVFTRGMIEELLWFLRGSSDVNELIEKNVHIWDGWRVTEEMVTKPSDAVKAGYSISKEKDFSTDATIITDTLKARIGSIGPLYGKMMRSAPGGGDDRIGRAIHGNALSEVRMKELASDRLAKVKAKAPKSGPEQDHLITEENYSIDQLQQLVLNLKNNPHSSRHLISCWFPEFLPDERLTPQENVLLGRQALAPCHTLFQFYVKLMTNEERFIEIQKTEHANDYLSLTSQVIYLNLSENEKEKEKVEWCKLKGVKYQKLSCQLYQRSLDTPIGGPINIASYALLTMMIAQCVNMVPDEFIWTIGDAHIYSNTVDEVKEQLTREPRALPIMKINPEVKDLFSFKIEDFELVGYDPHPAIKMVVSV